MYQGQVINLSCIEREGDHKITMKYPYCVSILIAIQVLSRVVVMQVQGTQEAKLSAVCPSKCGDVAIPYPFGTSQSCSRDDTFLLTCNDTHFDPPKPFWRAFEVLNISIDLGEMVVSLPISRGCYSGETNTIDKSSVLIENLTGSPFTYSSNNKFTSTGCATTTYITNGSDTFFISACASVCTKETIDQIETNCTGGIGCCQATIQKGLKNFGLSMSTYYNFTGVWRYNPCSFAFLVQQSKFNFNSTFITADHNFRMSLPVVLDWSIENQTCQANMSETACRSVKSNCKASTNGLGYLCKCSDGYQGNPYLKHGCQDIDECSLPGMYPCNGTCSNTPGSYTCECPKGYKGDPRVSCDKDQKSAVIIDIIAGLGGALVFALLIALSTLLYRKSKKRRIQIQREKFYKNNYALLETQLASCNGNIHRTKIFSLKEMDKATNKFHEARVVGRGGHGIVYKGMLLDNTVVAIKRSKPVDKEEEKEAEARQFINEVAILSQIDHRNVVQLIGCCLETEIPLLVYEFVSNGTLSDHLHLWKRTSSLSWDDRLRIVTEVASAVAYMHSAASRSIFHRDLKTSNILLDERLTAKVSDFGTSKSIMTDQTHITTAVQGTYGYLDPEYYYTGQLNEKSDVYAVGVILLEMLTGDKPYTQSKSQEERNLTTNFIAAFKENRSFQLVEAPLLEEASREELEVVMRLAELCLKMRGSERPTMKEVEMTLQGLRRKQNPKKQLTTTQQQQHCVDESEPSDRLAHEGMMIMSSMIGENDSGTGFNMTTQAAAVLKERFMANHDVDILR